MSPLMLLFAATVWAQEPAADADSDAPVEGEALEERVGPDRTSPPAVRPSEWLDLNEAEVHDLGEGRQVHLVRVPGVRMVEMTVYLHQGHVELGGRTAVTEGLGNFMAVATDSRTAQDMELLSDLHEISVDGFVHNHEGGAYLTVPAESIGKGLEVLGDVLHHPAYPASDIKRDSKQMVQYLSQVAPRSLRSSGWSALSHAWYPQNHPYGDRPDLKALKKLKSGEIAAVHDDWVATSPMSVLIVGDVAWADIESDVTQALDGVGVAGDRPARPSGPSHGGRHVVAVDMPGQTQATVIVRYAGPGLLHADRAAMRQANWVYGGHFLSRLNANLREDKGFTYGSRSSYSVQPTFGTITMSVDVKGVNVGATITEIQKEIDRVVKTGVDAKELDMAREDAVSSWNGTRETAATADGHYSTLHERGLSIADALAHGKAIEAITPEQAQAAAANWWGPEAGHVWVIAGDRATLEPQLDLGDVTWITPEQAILGTF